MLQAADVVIHDGLVSDEILDLALAIARRISVAKRKSRHSYAQDGINRMLVALALQGLQVVRLKGASPSCSAVAARSCWPAARPGSSAGSSPGSPPPWRPVRRRFGAPLTPSAGQAQAVTFVTGHRGEARRRVGRA